MTLDFVKNAGNVILLGPNGVGKSTIAQNITYQAIMHGHSALYVNAALMLGDLGAQIVCYASESYRMHEAKQRASKKK